LLEPPCRIGPMRGAFVALRTRVPPYLVLLRVGFTLPAALPSRRCALTAPFHPYFDRAEAVCFLWHWPSTGLEARVPDVIRHTALRSSDFPPPEAAQADSGSDRPVLLPDVSVTEMSDGTKDLDLSDLRQVRLNLTRDVFCAEGAIAWTASPGQSDTMDLLCP
jgi:hypothetical protein